MYVICYSDIDVLRVCCDTIVSQEKLHIVLIRTTVSKKCLFVLCPGHLDVPLHDHGPGTRVVSDADKSRCSESGFVVYNV